MLRKMLSGLIVICFGLGLTFAADTISQAKVKAVDYEKHNITVTVGDKDQTFKVQKEVKVFRLGKKKADGSSLEITLSGLDAVQVGDLVALTVEKNNLVSEVKISSKKKKKE